VFLFLKNVTSARIVLSKTFRGTYRNISVIFIETLGCHDPFHSEGISAKQDRIEKNALFAKNGAKSAGRIKEECGFVKY
jgi:hypothetical protein